MTQVEHYKQLMKANGDYVYAVVCEGTTYLYRDAKTLVMSLIHDFDHDIPKELLLITDSDGSTVPLLDPED